MQILHLLSSAVHGVGVVLDMTGWAGLDKGTEVGVVLDITGWAELDKGIGVGVVLDTTTGDELCKGTGVGDAHVENSKKVEESS